MDNDVELGSKGFKTLQKVKDMIRYAYPALAQFPKSEKFALAADIKRVMDEVLGYCIDAKRKKGRRTALEKMDSSLAKLKEYVELSHDLGFLATKKFGEWSKYNDEIGRMIGGMLATVASIPEQHRE